MANSNLRKVSNEQKNWSYSITRIFVAIMFFVFPLVFNDYYFDILQTKTVFYCACVIILFVSLLTYAFMSGRAMIFFESFNIKKFLKSLNVPDIAMMIFLLTAVLSTLQSDYLYESFWGNQGRYTGLLMLLLYGISYFIITRIFIFKEYYLDILLSGGMLVCLFGITDYFNLDLLNFKENINPKQYNIYTSTIGNINSYTAYLALIVAISFILFTISNKNIKKTIFYYITTVIGFFAIIMGQSDNAYLSMGALFLFAPFYLFATRTGLKRYIIMCISFLSVIKIIDIINNTIPDKVIGINGLFGFFAKGDYLLYMIAFLLAVIIIIYAFEKVLKKKEEGINPWLRWMWLALVALLIACVLVLLYLFNFTELKNSINGEIKQYFLFNDSWGNSRGYIWRIAIELFNDFSLVRKTIGFGPDTFGILTILHRYKEMINGYGVVFESAHNEYLQFLLTTGIAGLFSYLVFIIGSIINLFKHGKLSPAIIAIGFAVICYSVQAFVNINLPIVTPIMLILLMIGQSKNAK